METQLKELIDKIKTEGVAEAEGQAKSITEKAEQEASAILGKAHAEAEKIVADAQAEAGRFQETGKEALKQAGRDLILNLNSSITRLFGTVVESRTKEALTEKVLQKIITDLIHAWQKKGQNDIQVLLSAADLKKLRTGLLKNLSDEMKKGVELKPSPDIQAGFRIGQKDGAVYYDFTDKGIAENLVQYLNPKLAECLKAEKGKKKEKTG